jgi:hypothetical protein
MHGASHGGRKQTSSKLSKDKERKKKEEGRNDGWITASVSLHPLFSCFVCVLCLSAYWAHSIPFHHIPLLPFSVSHHVIVSNLQDMSIIFIFIFISVYYYIIIKVQRLQVYYYIIIIIISQLQQYIHAFHAIFLLSHSCFLLL